MGFAGVSISQLAIILLIVVVIFGTKRLKTISGDLGGAIKSFRHAVNSPDEQDKRAAEPTERMPALKEPGRARR